MGRVQVAIAKGEEFDKFNPNDHISIVNTDIETEGTMALESPKPITLDPVCGMEVDEQQPGDTYEYEKKTFYFCSVECKDKFAKDPAGYTGLENGKITL